MTLTFKDKKMLRKLNEKRNGAYFRLQYAKTVDEVSKKCPGYVVTKVTTISVRKGVDYSKLKSVVERKSNGGVSAAPARKPWYHHINKTLVKHNTKDEYYIQVFPNIFGKPHTQYFVNGKSVTLEELKNMGIMNNSFWNKKDTRPECLTIKVSNIIDIF